MKPATPVSADAGSRGPAPSASTTIRRFPTGRWWLPLAALLLVGGGLFGAQALSETPSAVRSGAARALPVRTQRPQAADGYVRRREFTGEVRARRHVELGFDLTGRVLEVRVDEGDAVEAGQPLVRLDTAKLEAERLGLQAQRREAAAVLAEMRAGPRDETVDAAREVVAELATELALLEKKQARRAQLLRERAISDEEYDEVQTRLLAVRARLRGAEDRLAELEEGTRAETIEAQEARIEALDARLARLDLVVEDACLKAPFGGRIRARMVDEGAIVVPGRTVLALVEDRALEAWVGVPPEVAGTLTLNTSHEVGVGAVSYDASLLAKLPATDAVTRTQTIVLRLPETAAAEVVPGQIARVHVEERVAAPGYWVPTTSLVRGVRGLWAVYAVEDGVDGTPRVVRHHVEVLHAGAERVFVRGTLREDARLVVGNTERIAPGQRVEPTEDDDR